MKRTRLLVALPCLAIAACGPMQRPMGHRLDDESQQKIDAAWEKALNPPGRLERQEWLDVFVATHAYQIGVDRLMFQSQKSFSGGLVVMEVVFDRMQPEQDRFEVTVYDLHGKPIRHDRYGRDEVERTCADLLEHLPAARPNEPEAPEVTKRRSQREARFAVVESLFPKPDGAAPK
jgi:hypothetical protein